MASLLLPAGGRDCSLAAQGAISLLRREGAPQSCCWGGSGGQAELSRNSNWRLPWLKSVSL